MCRGRLQPVGQPHLLRFCGFETTAADLRAYATLFWVAKTVMVGYLIVSLSTKQSAVGVSSCRC